MRCGGKEAVLALALAGLLAGCSDDGSPGKADGSPGQEGGAGSCAQGAETEVGRLCVRGTVSGTNEQLAADQPLRIQLYPVGCYSSSCTVRHLTTCSVTTSGNALQVEGLFCLENISNPSTGCTSDCNGGGTAECTSGPLPAGSYTVTLGKLSLDVQIPGTVPLGGACEGSQF